MTVRVLVLLVAACGHDKPASPPPALGSATEHLQQALAADGINQRGDTPVDTASIETFARSFVGILSRGDQRAALDLFHGEIWSPDCDTKASEGAAYALGGMTVSVPRNIQFAAATPVGDARTIVKGSKLNDCPVAADTTARTVRVTWTGPAGEATLEIARASHGWTLTAIHDR